MSQKRLRSDSAASTDPNTWTIFEPSSAPDADGDIIPTNPHDTKHSRHAVTSAPAITCFLPPSCAGTAFSSHELFESHYAQAHTNRCLECGKNFPSGRFLELHIAEHHDPLQELRRERGEKGVRRLFIHIRFKNELEGSWFGGVGSMDALWRGVSGFAQRRRREGGTLSISTIFLRCVFVSVQFIY